MPLTQEINAGARDCRCSIMHVLMTGSVALILVIFLLSHSPCAYRVMDERNTEGMPESSVSLTAGFKTVVPKIMVHGQRVASEVLWGCSQLQGS